MGSAARVAIDDVLATEATRTSVRPALSTRDAHADHHAAGRSCPPRARTRWQSRRPLLVLMAMIVLLGSASTQTSFGQPADDNTQCDTILPPTDVLNIVWVVHGPDPATPGAVVNTSLTIPYIIPPSQWSMLTDLSTNWTTAKGADVLGYQGLLLYYSLLQSRTGGTIPLPSGAVRVNLTVWNIGSLYHPQSYARAAYVAALTTGTVNFTANGTRIVTPSPYTFVISPTFTLVSISLLYMRGCEASRSCLSLQVTNTQSSTVSCQDPLPIDCTSKGRRAGERRFDFSISSVPDQTTTFTAQLELLRAKGAETIVILGQGDDVVTSAIPSLLNQVEELKLSVPFTLTLNSTGGYRGNTTSEQVAAQIIALNPDAVLWYVQPLDPSQVAAATFGGLMCDLWNAGWLPKAHIFFGGSADKVAAYCPAASFQYTWISIPWLPTLHGLAYRATSIVNFTTELFPATSTLDSPAIFYETFVARYPHSLGMSVTRQPVWPAFGASTLNVIHRLVDWASTNDLTALRLSVGTISLPSFWGLMQFDRFGRLVRTDSPALQWVPNPASNSFPYATIAPVNIATDPIYPMPTLAERVWAPRFYAQTSERIAVLIIGLLLVYFALLAIWLWIYQSHSVVRTSTPLFLLFLLLGAALMVTSILFDTLYVTTPQCLASTWLLSLGYSLAYSSLLLKTYRVCSIYEQKAALGGVAKPPVRLTTLDLCTGVLAMLLIDVILNVTWDRVVSGGIHAERIVVDQARPAYDYTQCEYGGRVGNVFIGLHLAIKCSVILVSTILVYRTRSVPSRFNESGWLALSTYNMALLCALFLPLIASASSSRVTTFNVRSYGIMLMAGVTVSLMLLPKVVQIELDRRRVVARKKAAAAAALAGGTGVAALLVPPQMGSLAGKPPPTPGATPIDASPMHPTPREPGGRSDDSSGSGGVRAVQMCDLPDKDAGEREGMDARRRESASAPSDRSEGRLRHQRAVASAGTHEDSDSARTAHSAAALSSVVIGSSRPSSPEQPVRTLTSPVLGAGAGAPQALDAAHPLPSRAALSHATAPPISRFVSLRPGDSCAYSFVESQFDVGPSSAMHPSPPFPSFASDYFASQSAAAPPPPPRTNNQQQLNEEDEEQDLDPEHGQSQL